MSLSQEAHSALSRRTVVTAAGAAGLAATLTACGSEDSDSVTSGDSPQKGSGPLAKVSDIPEGGGKVFKDAEVVVTQPTKGNFKAFSGICTHQGCSLGDVSDGLITCPCHGSKFSIEDGSVKHPPATKSLAEAKIEVSGDEIKLV